MAAAEAEANAADWQVGNTLGGPDWSRMTREEAQALHQCLEREANSFAAVAGAVSEALSRDIGHRYGFSHAVSSTLLSANFRGPEARYFAFSLRVSSLSAYDTATTWLRDAISGDSTRFESSDSGEFTTVRV